MKAQYTYKNFIIKVYKKICLWFLLVIIDLKDNCETKTKLFLAKYVWVTFFSKITQNVVYVKIKS